MVLETFRGTWRPGAAEVTYTPDEVLRLLIDDGRSPAERRRAAVVRACAACLAEWSARLDHRTAHRLGERLVSRLPSVVAWYSSGVPIPEIGRRVGHFGGTWEIDQALRAAATCIAAQLNSLR